MSFFLMILGIVVLTAILNILIIQSNNFLFIVFKRPFWWIVFMGILSFVTFFIGSQLKNSFNIVWLSLLIALILNIPPKKSKDLKTAIDDVYGEMGIKRGKLKYRLGLIAYVLGGIIGWVLFYGRIVQQGV